MHTCKDKKIVKNILKYCKRNSNSIIVFFFLTILYYALRRSCLKKLNADIAVKIEL